MTDRRRQDDCLCSNTCTHHCRPCQLRCGLYCDLTKERMAVQAAAEAEPNFYVVRYAMTEKARVVEAKQWKNLLP